MEYFFIAYLAMLVFLFTKLRRLQHSPSFQAAFGLLILVPLSLAINALDFDWLDSECKWVDAVEYIVLALSMFNLGRALFHQPNDK
ncbi:MAG: hypothetical protein CMJ93_08245 [Planctomycetes bacterium]|jgi:hypothetical protein|nr:hypothetical protein [Planctomycetota bacterium]